MYMFIFGRLIFDLSNYSSLEVNSDFINTFIYVGHVQL